MCSLNLHVFNYLINGAQNQWAIQVYWLKVQSILDSFPSVFWLAIKKYLQTLLCPLRCILYSLYHIHIFFSLVFTVISSVTFLFVIFLRCSLTHKPLWMQSTSYQQCPCWAWPSAPTLPTSASPSYRSQPHTSAWRSETCTASTSTAAAVVW